ncbi:hypothetical protein PT974_03859 [Cladobotryum mycophilum]|uniref:RING-type domain-containing protein n=1 Tax=Cladobotryum mycophilum TaxID=491253 RepID=A0ABR0STH3_9HYPO
MDERSIQLALQLQWEELKSMKSQIKDRSHTEQASDFGLALELYRTELMTVSAYRGDRTITMSVARAVMSDGDIITASIQEEEQALQDREMAQRLARGEGNQNAGRPPAPHQPIINHQPNRPLSGQPRPPRNVHQPNSTSNPGQTQAFGRMPPPSMITISAKPQPPIQVEARKVQSSNNQSTPATATIPGNAAPRSNPNKRPINSTPDNAPTEKWPKMYGSSAAFLPTSGPISARAPGSSTTPGQGKRPAPNGITDDYSATKRQKVDHSGNTTATTSEKSSSGEEGSRNEGHSFTPIIFREPTLFVQPPAQGTGRKRQLDPDLNELGDCIACGESTPASDMAKCPCSHQYCRKCLTRLFEMSIKDESLFPPRCCKKSIPLEDHRNILSSKLAGEFKAKEIEFRTPNRTYCHDPACSTFIPLQFIKNDVGTCAQFCYVCGAKWKNCQCILWDEGSLIRTANERVERDPNARALQGEQRAQAVAVQVERLRNDDECEHDDFKYLRGEHECEICGDVLPWFIYECRECGLWACGECRYNRLDEEYY